MWDTMSIKSNYKIPKNCVVLVYDEKVPRHFWRIAIVTRVLPSRDFEIKEEIVGIAKTNAILKRLVNWKCIYWKCMKIQVMTLTKQTWQGNKSEGVKQP